MVIVGYYAHGNKHYVAFKDEADTKGRFMITDGFHDRPVTERNQGKYEGYVKIDKSRVQYQEDYRPYSWYKTVASASEITAEGSGVIFYPGNSQM